MPEVLFFKLTNTLSSNAKFSLSCTRDPSPHPGNCHAIHLQTIKPVFPYMRKLSTVVYFFKFASGKAMQCARTVTYLMKAKTLSMKFFRFIGVAAMLEYFLDSSLGPPIAIETFSFGFFCFKRTTLLYWPAGWQSKR